jgi:hypothetical protein
VAMDSVREGRGCLRGAERSDRLRDVVGGESRGARRGRWPVPCMYQPAKSLLPLPLRGIGRRDDRRDGRSRLREGDSDNDGTCEPRKRRHDSGAAAMPGGVVTVCRRSRGSCPFAIACPGPDGPGYASLGRQGGLGRAHARDPTARVLPGRSGGCVPLRGTCHWLLSGAPAGRGCLVCAVPVAASRCAGLATGYSPAPLRGACGAA